MISFKLKMPLLNLIFNGLHSLVESSINQTVVNFCQLEILTVGASNIRFINYITQIKITLPVLVLVDVPDPVPK